MSLEILNQLESKIQQAIDTVGLLQMEIDELRDQKQQLELQISNSSSDLSVLQEENQRLKQEQSQWQDRLQSLLNRMSDIK